MNVWDVVIVALITLVVVLALWARRRAARRGCGCGCAGCLHAASCAKSPRTQASSGADSGHADMGKDRS